jgi:hypothetical protein
MNCRCLWRQFLFICLILYFTYTSLSMYLTVYYTSLHLLILLYNYLFILHLFTVFFVLIFVVIYSFLSCCFSIFKLPSVQACCAPSFTSNLGIAVAEYTKAFFRFINFVCCFHAGLGEPDGSLFHCRQQKTCMRYPAPHFVGVQ